MKLTHTTDFSGNKATENTLENVFFSCGWGCRKPCHVNDLQNFSISKIMGDKLKRGLRGGFKGKSLNLMSTIDWMIMMRCGLKSRNNIYTFFLCSSFICIALCPICSKQGPIRLLTLPVFPPDHISKSAIGEVPNFHLTVEGKIVVGGPNSAGVYLSKWRSTQLNSFPTDLTNKCTANSQKK